MRLVVVVALAACGGAPAAVPHNTAVASRREVLTFRRLETGLITARSTLATYVLRLGGGRATLEVAREHAEGSLREVARISGWEDDDTVRYAGTARPEGDGLVLELAGPQPRLVLRCAWREVEVAGARAVRARSPGAAECGDPGRWQPAQTTRVRALVCREPAAAPAPPPSADPDEARQERARAERDAVRTQLTFGDGPGIEYLYVNDDCVIQGGGLRAIPPNGSIGDIRPER